MQVPKWLNIQKRKIYLLFHWKLSPLIVVALDSDSDTSQSEIETIRNDRVFTNKTEVVVAVIKNYYQNKYPEAK